MDKIISCGKEDGGYIVHLSTFDFQGPEFYAAMGFKLYATLPNVPMNHNELFFYKEIERN